ncbi:DoxX family membrane protein [Candidatus Gracilibacteria bacterium]|nr:DoxX family membrane protein [Candidatus Gracilibacteria bacterium]MCF7898629.1 DoxX family membrane protein [Candidatus Paceibacterota bacterium]
MRIKIQQSRLADFAFGDTSMSYLWTIIRLYVGYVWLMAGWSKIWSPVWVGPQAGTALNGFLNGALSKTSGLHPEVTSWYAYFIEHFALNHTVLLSYLVAYGEVAVGVALIVGLLVGVSSFFGIFMNFNFLLAGTASINPQLVILQFLLILAWRTAGYIGADRFVLPRLFRKKK